MSKLFTYKEVMAILSISKPTLTKLVRNGKIKRIDFGIKMYRYDEDDINKFLSDSKTGGGN